MPRLISVDDTDWPEVRSINTYAIFMGYLLMGVRGLGLLVLTWTTVVLLGGFLSMLNKKDFWCLTVITLVQTAGVFDFLLKEKASDIGNYMHGSLAAIFAVVLKPLKRDRHMSVSEIEKDKGQWIVPFALAIILSVVQLLVFLIVLCPLAVLYVLGLYISSGISLWRLIQHDYGNPDGGENLKPALNILYSLAMAQGMIYGYRTIYDLAARDGLVEDVSSDYSLQTELVLNYLEETVTGCMKDPSFATGRNLITYAVDLLMESRSRHGYVTGVKILGTTLQPNNWNSGQRNLIKQLLTGSASSSHVVQRLLETFGPRSPYSTKVREHAARIVANVAGNIHLDQFPEGMIQCISSLLDTFEEYHWEPEGYERHMKIPEEYGRDWLLEEDELFDIACNLKIPRPAGNKSPERDSGTLLQDYRVLVVQGLRILQKLAANEGNCRAIRNNEGLLSKIMAPLMSDHLHAVVPSSLFYSHLLDHRDGWSIIAEESLELMSRLIATPGATGRKLRSEISGNSKAIITAILECNICGVLLKRQAVEILLDLSGCIRWKQKHNIHGVTAAHFSFGTQLL